MLGCLSSVTPPNWCSITTGCWPRTHGITCYTNQTLGSALNLEEANLDNSNVTADFIWQAFEKEGKRSIALNYCEAWPPRNTENDLTVLIDGGISAFLSTKMAPFLMKFGGIGYVFWTAYYFSQNRLYSFHYSGNILFNLSNSSINTVISNFLLINSL